MATIDLTTAAEVRALLGVSAAELKDTVLQSPVYSTLLNEDLLALDADIVNEFSTAAALSSRTQDQERFVDLMQAYASYHMAAQCLGSIAMFAPQVIKDARSELGRAVDPYKQLRIDVPTIKGRLRTKLRAAYAKIKPGYTPPTAAERVYALPATPGTNVITG